MDIATHKHDCIHIYAAAYAFNAQWPNTHTHACMHILEDEGTHAQTQCMHNIIKINVDKARIDTESLFLGWGRGRLVVGNQNTL